MEAVIILLNIDILSWDEMLITMMNLHEELTLFIIFHETFRVSFHGTLSLSFPTFGLFP